MKITFPKANVTVVENFGSTDGEKESLWHFLNTTHPEQYYVEATSDGVTFSDHYDPSMRSFSIAVQPVINDEDKPSEESSFNTYEVIGIMMASAVHYPDRIWLVRFLRDRLDRGVVFYSGDGSVSVVGRTFAQMMHDNGS